MELIMSKTYDHTMYEVKDHCKWHEDKPIENYVETPLPIFYISVENNFLSE